MLFTRFALSLLVVGAMLARRNLHQARGIAVGLLVWQLLFLWPGVSWFFGAHHVPNFAEFPLFMEFLVWGIFLSCFFWVLYIALEPYVRRRWPATLVSWSRLLAGGFRDPLVGRDVLVGCLFAAFILEWEASACLFPPGWVIFRRNQSRGQIGNFWGRAQ